MNKSLSRRLILILFSVSLFLSITAGTIGNTDVSVSTPKTISDMESSSEPVSSSGFTSSVNSFSASSPDSVSSTSSRVSSQESSSTSIKPPSPVAVTPSSKPASSGKAPPFQSPSKMSIGYYGGWAAYSGFPPDKINVSSLNVLHYAFAVIGTDNKIKMGDPTIDPSNFQKLKKLKSKNHGLQTVLSVGGWDDSGRFSDMALTESSRAAFADSVAVFLLKHGFDGVDIDWEYPSGGGKSGNVTRAADRDNFIRLLQTLRKRLDEQGAKDGKHYILSFAGSPNSQYINRIDLSGAAACVDYGMIMTYDLHGSWDPYTDLNAPLYLPDGQSPQYKTSVDSGVSAWLKNGFPAEKLLLGLPFYGYVYSGAADAGNGLWQTFSSASPAGYDAIRKKHGGDSAFKRSWCESAQVPWLFNGSVFISYDDVSSIQKKVSYAASKNLLGVGIWELSFDRNGSLLQTVLDTLK